MNWSLVLKYLPVLATVAIALETLVVQVASGQPATSPPISTYIGGKHGTITVTWTPTA